MSDLVALPADALPEGACGLITFWRLGGGPVVAADLEVAWAEAGLPVEWLPPAVTPGAALKRALDAETQAASYLAGKCLIRPVDPGREWHVVVETVSASGEERDLDHSTVFKARLTPAGALKLTGDPELQRRVRASFALALEQLTERDLSSWLPRVVDRLDAAHLRPAGGVYFVPPAHVPTWDRVRGALGKVSHASIERIPAMRGADAAQAILRGLVDDARAQVAAAVEDLSRSEVTRRAADARKAELSALSAKVQRYEELLGAVASGFQDVLDGAEEALMQAYARADAPGDGAP